MDNALLSMALNQGKIHQEASMAVMKKALGNAEQQGEALQKLMVSAEPVNVQQAPHPFLGSNLVIKL